MNTKEELVENIKKWVKYDHEIKSLQKSIKDIRDKKKQLTSNLIDVMKTHEIDCFDINDGKLLYTKNKVKTPLNKINLLSALEKYFENEKVSHDSSGNKKLNDIGVYLKNRIKDHFSKTEKDVTVKYIDPSYIIRSVPANPEDGVFCGFLAEHAVHAAMSGKTRVIIGRWNENFINLPMDIVKAGRKKIDPKGPIWQSVLLSTGQPSLK